MKRLSVTAIAKKVKIISFVLPMIFISVTAHSYAADSVAINKSNFPDECFRSYVSTEFDTDGNGFLSDAEISNAIEIDIFVGGNEEYEAYRELASFDGIELLTNLDTVRFSGLDYLERIDMSKNKAITRLSCQGELLSEIRIDGLSYLNELDCSTNENLRTLDISTCPKIMEAVKKGQRESLSCIVTYEYSTTGLYAELVYNGWTDLIYDGESHLPGIPVLKEYFPDEGFRYDLLMDYDYDEDGCLSWEEIAKTKSASFGTNARSLQGMEYFTALESLYIDANYVTDIDFTKNPTLKSIDCSMHPITTIDVTGLADLEELDVYETDIKYLDLRTNTSLKKLYSYKNPGMTIDITGNDALIYALLNGRRSERDDIDQLNIFYKDIQLSISKDTKFIFEKPENTINANDVSVKFNLKKQTLYLSPTVLDNASLSYTSGNSKYISVDKKTGKVTVSKAYVGKAVITITSSETEKYAETKKKITIRVNPAAPKLTSAKNTAKKKVTLKWKKTSSTKCTGYQIQYSTSKDFSDDTTKTVKVKGVKKTSRSISKLKKGTKYYIRIRAYLSYGGDTYYSPWSSKSVKVKK